MERKDFIKFLAASVASGSLIAYLESCKENNDGSFTDPSEDFTLDLSLPANAALLKAGGVIISNNVVVINNNGSYIAVSDLCTHQGCALGYNTSTQHFDCSCHGSVFAQNGSVITGPATTPLKTYNVVKNSNSLHVSG